MKLDNFLILMIFYFFEDRATITSNKCFLRILSKNSCCSKDQISTEVNEILGRMADNLVRNQVGCTFLAGEKIRRVLVTRTRRTG